jgi:hypothetical protein
MHAKFHPPTHRTMQSSTIIAGAAAIAIGVWDDPGWRASTILAFAGLLGLLAQAILSRFWVVPMSDELISWGEGATPPADPQKFLRTWALLHGGRTLGALFAFFCYLLSLILR